MKCKTSTAVAVVSTLFAQTSSATTSYCPSDSKDVCFRWGVPEASASSGSGSIYFRMEAPTSYQWVGLGIGSRMRGSDMFLMYQDGKGNVTLSPRTAGGHSMPEHMERSDVELLAGSGVSNDTMIANIKCGKCDGLDLGDSNSWIAAWRGGNPLDSTDTSERIQVHDGMGSFQVDFSQASISSDENPFIGASNSNSSSNDSSMVVEEEDHSNNYAILRTHAVIMSIVFLAGYPLGAIVMPLIGNWLVHAGWQTIVFLAMWTGLGLGAVVANRADISYSETHLALGVAVCALMAVQPVLGWLHHRHFVQTQSRGLFSYAHIWYGRALMILGIINGGLGLKLAHAKDGYIIAYSVVAGVALILYVSASLFKGLRKKQPGREKLPASPQASESSARRV